ncbi:hypothetical protein LR48_Vigan08g074100 [Vigna angularis]|uniref:Uncharacterized protein n=1 Tax=Phaseolus angularis TaxID=3914 RepID=A0A0L9V5C9_PHAAN|nr:hypothetical protein LR48_Vigan08g074100 [Vigna angularis]
MRYLTKTLRNPIKDKGGGGKGSFLLTLLSKTKKEEKGEEKSPFARRRPYGSTDNRDRRRERKLSRACGMSRRWNAQECVDNEHEA